MLRRGGFWRQRCGLLKATCAFPGYNFLASTRSLHHYVDKWNCLQIKIPEGSEGIDSATLGNLLTEARQQGNKAAWLDVDGRPDIVPLAFEHGFKFHVAHDDKYVLYNWLHPTESSTLPPPLTHQLGVSSFCLNSKGQLLIVKDKGTLKFFGNYWKLPGGRVDLHEPISRAAERELFEECGVRATFKSILGFRETLKHPAVHLQRADIFFITRLELENPDDDTIVMCERELLDAAWVDLEQIGSEKYPTSPIFDALMSVAKEGIDRADWDSVDIKRKSYQLGVGKSEKQRNSTFSFYRR